MCSLIYVFQKAPHVGQGVHDEAVYEETEFTHTDTCPDTSASKLYENVPKTNEQASLTTPPEVAREPPVCNNDFRRILVMGTCIIGVVSLVLGITLTCVFLLRWSSQMGKCHSILILKYFIGKPCHM